MNTVFYFWMSIIGGKMKRAIIVDSTAKLGEEAFNHPDLYQIALSVNFTGEETSYVDTWKKDEISEFYEKMEKSSELPKTSQPSPEEFVNAFQDLVDKGYESVIVILLASSISGTYQTAKIVAESFKDQLEIFMVDSGTTSLGMENMVMHVLRWYGDERCNDEIMAKLNKIVEHTMLYVAFDDMTNVVKGGRINHLAGSIVQNLKVVVIIDVNKGKVGLAKINRGRKRALKSMDKLLNNYINQTPGDFSLGVIHTRYDEDAKEQASRLEEEYPQAKNIFVDDISIVIATHIGDHALAYAYLPYIE